MPDSPHRLIALFFCTVLPLEAHADGMCRIAKDALMAGTGSLLASDGGPLAVLGWGMTMLATLGIALYRGKRRRRLGYPEWPSQDF